ncbi:ABC transporter permease [Mycolicibacterium sp. ND9-15]|nr:ABC transporter permease [Mycolicibacterium sp. ND9-15]WSE58861.1 ABC transporter permease [Mycolicibacterium sp. ND9-15]
MLSHDSRVRLRRVGDAVLRVVDRIGEHAAFYALSIRYLPLAATRYRGETLRLVAEMTMGVGALVMIGGTVGVAAFLTLASGGIVAVQGYKSLGDIGIEALTGFLSAFLNVRIIAPVIAGIALAATIGAGSTAQLGAMRVSQEIDALEAMAVRSIAYLVSTRLIAGLVAVIPLYSLSVLAAFFAARFTTVYINGQSRGVYDHYFDTFLIPENLLWSFVQATLMAVAVMLVHTYYGYHASGGPVGVGVATGHAVRLSLILVVITTLFVSLAVYGASSGFTLSG